MTSRVVLALRVPGPPARVFRVFTEDVGLWWRDNPLFRFTPRSPGVLMFEPPSGDARGRFVEKLLSGKTFLIGEVAIWEPGRKLLFGWRQAAFSSAQNTQVEITFEAVGAETRVTVGHRGWDKVPPEHVARHSIPAPILDLRLGQWWRTLLASLCATLG